MIGHARRAPYLRGILLSWHFFTGLPLTFGYNVWLSCVGDFRIWIPSPCRETHRKHVKDSSCWYRYLPARILECLLHLCRPGIFNYLNAVRGLPSWFADVQVRRCRSEDVQVRRCRSADVKVRRCRSAGVKVRRCGSADVLQWLLFYEEPFAGAFGNMDSLKSRRGKSRRRKSEKRREEKRRKKKIKEEKVRESLNKEDAGARKR